MTSRRVRSFSLVAGFSMVALAAACGGVATSPGSGDAGLPGTSPGPTVGDAAISAVKDMAVAPNASDAATPADAASSPPPVDPGDAAVAVDAGSGDASAPRTVPTGAWQVKTLSDEMTAGFQTVAINADGTYSQTGRSDGIGETGLFTQPATIDVGDGFGTPPAGMVGPYLELGDDPQGDAYWVYGWSEASDASSLTLALYAKTNGMGLRWADGAIIQLVPAGTTQLPASPAGSWKAASPTDAQNAGFQTVTLDPSGGYAEAGRTDGQYLYGTWSSIATPTVDPSLGNPPAGIVAPYVELSNAPNDDGRWDYAFALNADGSLTLTLCAQTKTMGLRWVDPAVVLHFVKS